MPRLSDEMVRERLAYRMTTGQLHAYYFGFDYTGQEPIDLILAAVADAGKAYHSTESWNEEVLAPQEGREEYSYIDIIQAAAEIAAHALLNTRRERDEARAALREAIALARDMNEGDAYDRWRRALGEEQDA